MFGVEAEPCSTVPGLCPGRAEAGHRLGKVCARVGQRLCPGRAEAVPGTESKPVYVSAIYTI